MSMMLRGLMGACAMTALAAPALAETLTIATVNNGDMIRMQKMTKPFTDANPDIQLEWVTLEENVLRQRVTTDIATKGGQYDIVTVGNYEVPIWAKQGWLTPLEDMGEDYDAADILPPIAEGLSLDGKLYAAPFYGESAMIMYRTDLMEKAGLEMPERPTWDFVYDAARKMTDKSAEVYGICLRGKAGWGENMAFLTSMGASYGAPWFDMEWKPQFSGEAWKKALTDYVAIMNEAGPPGASSNGFNENLALFQIGKCGMWIDATVAASFVSNPKDSTVADKVGYALAPEGEKPQMWLWAWTLAIPSSTDAPDAAKKFVAWATSKAYTEQVAAAEGWANVPPGTRTSLYENPAYLEAAPFAKPTLDSIMSADLANPTTVEVPYIGTQWVGIPEFQALGTAVGQQFSAALAGQASVEQALQMAQQIAEREMARAGYPK
ncbi:sugar ABC transporter substrate-binding protein [Paracoccus sp. P2]|uniref:Sugar ABC transporter substrate-binding protein n=1 Tax=Paracoccus pantotrophus TaxID=82367 RepID=A0A7H9BQ69_PARPN|nr:sugar ABC transporter substrate-binding protein [Paracoccus pantotrophus]QLH13460.1 sugar ABC transporter substrate-binding protein [Paracoccus pantotrophus]RDD96699.1 sugar ABC transporter substrate-binding protein [Paracoccus pantotrophus]RNI16977.1 sugar ABC transporter substrate-binding protein [Paracoccus pantotrophus]WGR67325.1 sugar ABC transporter substrate-binding protein [Paracoccus pantotrophus]